MISYFLSCLLSVCDRQIVLFYEIKKSVFIRYLIFKRVVMTFKVTLFNTKSKNYVAVYTRPIFLKMGIILKYSISNLASFTANITYLFSLAIPFKFVLHTLQITAKNYFL